MCFKVAQVSHSQCNNSKAGVKRPLCSRDQVIYLQSGKQDTLRTCTVFLSVSDIMVSFLQHNNITLFTPNNKYKCHHTFLCSQQSVSVGSVPGKVLNNYSIVVSEEQGVLWGKLITGRVLCVVWRIKRLTDG